MNKLKTMMLMAGLAVGTTMSAAEDSLFMIFSHSDGTVTQIEIPFPDYGQKSPVMKFSDTTIELTIPSEIDGETPALYSITVEDVENTAFYETTSVKPVTIANSAVFTPLGGNSIRIAATEEITADGVCVYDLMGKRLSCPVTVDGTMSTVSLADLPSGAYIIVYHNNSIKVTKK